MLSLRTRLNNYLEDSSSCRLTEDLVQEILNELARKDREIERLKTSVKALSGQLQYVGAISTGAAENVARNMRIDGDGE